jgi:hypothetical protein
MGWGVRVTPRPLSTPGTDPVPIVQEAGWAPGPVWTGAENLSPPRFDPRTVEPVVSRYTDWATRLTTARNNQRLFLVTCAISSIKESVVIQQNMADGKPHKRATALRQLSFPHLFTPFLALCGTRPNGLPGANTRPCSRSVSLTKSVHHFYTKDFTIHCNITPSTPTSQ